MKHNFMTKMVSALLAVVLSTAAFSVTAFASGGEESTESVTEQETAGMFLICFPLWQAARSRYPSPRMVSSSVPAKMTPGRPAPSPRAAAI